MNYYKLGSTAMDGAVIDSLHKMNVLSKLYCQGCRKYFVENNSIDVTLQEDIPDNPLDVVPGIGIIRKDLLEAIGYDVVDRELMLGNVSYPSDFILENHFTFRAKKLINIFSNEMDVKKCDICGYMDGFPFGKYYILNGDFEGTEVFENLFHGLVVSERILERINKYKWRKMSVMKLFMIHKPLTGCEEIPSFYRQGSGNKSLPLHFTQKSLLNTNKKEPSLEEFLDYLIANSPTFHCYDPSDNEEKIGFSIVVEHILSDGASEEELQVLRTLLKEGYEQVETFYRIHNGIRMYCQSGNPAVELFSIDEWEEKTSDALSWFEGYDDDDLYDFQKYGVAIGEVTDSANYFIFYKGKVYYSEHDGGSDETGDLFFEFLERFRSDPVKTFQEMGGYVRYSDGKTRVQWIPKKYSDG